MSEYSDARCDMCGGDISTTGVCIKCGNIITSEEILIDKPDWGHILIDLSSYRGSKKGIIEKINSVWNHLEKNTSQKLFSGQSLLTLDSSDTVQLIGAKESYLILRKEIETAYSLPKGWVGYNSLPHDEIYKLRGY